MGFKARLKFVDGVSHLPPARAYFHGSDFMKYDVEDFNEYFSYFLLCMKQLPSEPGRFDYVIGVVWKDLEKNGPIADMFGFNNLNGWPGNPDVHIWSMTCSVFSAA